MERQYIRIGLGKLIRIMPDHNKMIEEVHRAVIGNPLAPDKEPGLLSIVLAMRGDINGTAERPLGLRQKVEKMWDNQNRVIVIGGFIMTVGGVAGWFISVVFK